MTLVVMAWAGRHFYARAWSSFRHHAADMNTLIAVGTGAAFLYSVLATVAPGFFLSRGVPPDVYYEAVVIIIALILAGNALEARAKSRHLGSPARPRRAPAADRPRAAGRRGDATCRSSGCGAGTSCSSAPASACRSTARSSRGRARSTSRC